MSEFLQNISTAISQDPGLPRANPTLSSWQVPVHPSASIESPTLPQQTDFAIISPGITGCSVAKTLREHPSAADSYVMVHEARTLVSGATGRNGGHLVTASGHTFGPLADRLDVETAKQIKRFSILNVEHIMSMVGETGRDLQGDNLQQNPLTGKSWIGNETAYLKDILTSDDTEFW